MEGRPLPREPDRPTGTRPNSDLGISLGFGSNSVTMISLTMVEQALSAAGSRPGGVPEKLSPGARLLLEEQVVERCPVFAASTGHNEGARSVVQSAQGSGPGSV